MVSLIQSPKLLTFYEVILYQSRLSIIQLVIKLLKQPTSSPRLSGRQLEVGGGHLGPADLAIASLLPGRTNTTIDPSLGHLFSRGDR